MSLLLLDTNIILEFLFAQERKEECRKLLERVASGAEEAILLALTLYSIEITMTREKNDDALFQFLTALKKWEGLIIYHTTLDDDLAALRARKRFNIDFDDALHYAVAKHHECTLVSFDHDFDRTDIKRAEPKSLLA